MMKGLWVCDPGKQSGVAWAIVDTTADSVTDAMRKRLLSGSETITGDEATQIRRLYASWMRFKNNCVQEHMMYPAQIECVFEDFVLFAMKSKGKEGTMPERLIWGFEGYRLGRLDQWTTAHKAAHYSPLVLQAAQRKTKHEPREKLTSYDAWIVGKEHERTAFAHMAARLLVLRGGQS